MKKPVYLDYNATTLLKPDVLSIIGEILAETGNASSVHSFGRTARKHVEEGRRQVAKLAGVTPSQVVFTGGATESNNTVLCSWCPQRILVSAIEHPSVIETVSKLEFIPVTKDGVVDMAGFKALLETGEPPALISVMMVNNETGAIQPVAEMARMAKDMHKDVHFHTDAVQAAGRIPIDMPSLHVDYLSLSAHKMGGPQGVGALISAPGAQPVKLLCGGGQEKKQRAGTENVAGIAGFGKAAELALTDMENYQKLVVLRDEMEDRLQKIAPELVVFAKNAPRVANTSAISLPGISSEMQVMALDLEGIAISGGSACSSGNVKVSPVMKAMQLSEDEMVGALRISLGWNTTKDDIDRLIEAWSKIYDRVKDEEPAQPLQVSSCPE